MQKPGTRKRAHTCLGHVQQFSNLACRIAFHAVEHTGVRGPVEWFCRLGVFRLAGALASARFLLLRGSLFAGPTRGLSTGLARCETGLERVHDIDDLGLRLLRWRHTDVFSFDFAVDHLDDATTYLILVPGGIECVRRGLLDQLQSELQLFFLCLDTEEMEFSTSLTAPPWF